MWNLGNIRWLGPLPLCGCRVRRAALVGIRSFVWVTRYWLWELCRCRIRHGRWQITQAIWHILVLAMDLLLKVVTR